MSNCFKTKRIDFGYFFKASKFQQTCAYVVVLCSVPAAISSLSLPLECCSFNSAKFRFKIKLRIIIKGSFQISRPTIELFSCWTMVFMQFCKVLKLDRRLQDVINMTAFTRENPHFFAK